MNTRKTVMCGVLVVGFLTSHPTAAQDDPEDVAALKTELKAAEQQLQRLQARVLELVKENARLKAVLAESSPGEVRDDAGEKPDGDPPKRRGPVTATPESFHEEVVRKADSLGLTAPKVSKLLLEKSLQDWDAWQQSWEFGKRRITWTVKMLGVRDADTHIAELSWELEKATRRRGPAKTTLAYHRQERPWENEDPKEKAKKAEEAEKVLQDVEKQIKLLEKEVEEAKVYAVEVTATAVGNDEIPIVAYVHKEDRGHLGSLPAGSEVTLRGYIHRVTCKRKTLGKPKLPIELVRCRVRKR
ncbi:MAG TPA: hypothetical protein VMZ92_12920 [Planctomycetota bacterium]|nr:hypothetical protein [Planctomycetota bacterium]